MNTQYFTKPFEKKHRTTTIWRGSTVLALAAMLIPVWQTHDDNKTLISRNSALWQRIQQQEQEISDLRSEVAWLEGKLNVPHKERKQDNE